MPTITVNRWPGPTTWRLGAVGPLHWAWHDQEGRPVRFLEREEAMEFARGAAQRELRAWQLRPENHHTDRWVKVRQVLLASGPDGEPDDAAIVAAVEGVGENR